MSEIYWLTRLDQLAGLFNVWAFFSAIALLVAIYLILDDFKDEVKRTAKIIRNVSIVVFIISVLGRVFVPTEKEMTMILGLGQTIDYIQENKTIKELPDKCVEALDAWVESLTKEE